MIQYIPLFEDYNNMPKQETKAPYSVDDILTQYGFETTDTENTYELDLGDKKFIIRSNNDGDLIDFAVSPGHTMGVTGIGLENAIRKYIFPTLSRTIISEIDDILANDENWIADEDSDFVLKYRQNPTKGFKFSVNKYDDSNIEYPYYFEMISTGTADQQVAAGAGHQGIYTKEKSGFRGSIKNLVKSQFNKHPEFFALK